MDIFEQILDVIQDFIDRVGRVVAAAIFILGMGVLFYFLYEAGLLGLGR